jgi:hypothetical protein
VLKIVPWYQGSNVFLSVTDEQILTEFRDIKEFNENLPTHFSYCSKYIS